MNVIIKDNCEFPTRYYKMLVMEWIDLNGMKESNKKILVEC